MIIEIKTCRDENLFLLIEYSSIDFLPDNFFLEIEQGKIRWYHIDTAGKTVFFIVTESLMPAKTWVHIAGTYNVHTGEVRFFINAEESKLTMGKGEFFVNYRSSYPFC